MRGWAQDLAQLFMFSKVLSVRPQFPLWVTGQDSGGLEQVPENRESARAWKGMPTLHCQQSCYQPHTVMEMHLNERSFVPGSLQSYLELNGRLCWLTAAMLDNAAGKCFYLHGKFS